METAGKVFLWLGGWLTGAGMATAVFCFVLGHGEESGSAIFGAALGISVTIQTVGVMKCMAIRSAPLCVALLLAAPAWGQTLLWEQSRSDSVSNVPFGTTMTFGIESWPAPDWQITATGTGTHHIPAELLPGWSQALTTAGPTFVDLQCCGGSPFPHLAPNLDRFRITDITQTIDQFVIEQIQPGDWRKRGSFTVRVYGSEIPAMPGDFNWDGEVSSADYVVWRQRIENGGEMPNGTIEGIAMPADYGLWRANYGRSALAPTIGVGAAIPEPTTFVLLLFAHCLWIRLPRR